MPVIERPSGVRVTVPDSLRVAKPPPAGPRRRGSLDSPLVPDDAASSWAEASVLLSALETQQIQVVDAVPLEPAPGAATAGGPVGRRRRGPVVPVAPRQSVELSLPIQADEHAVVLLEQDGVYRWKLPDEVARPANATRRRGTFVEPALGTVTFRFDVHASPEAASAARRQSRGVVSHFVFGRVRAYVLKFAAHAIVGEVMQHLERNVRTGLVAISSPDPTTWAPIEPSKVKLPRNRPAGILLLVHGTFSSTVGCFGGLGAHPWGKEFLKSALGEYDAVLGFDHRTLGVDPLVNGSELIEQLRLLGGGRPPSLDIVTHSRGGLVTRSLIELLLPFERDWQPQIEHVVFVASTNHGTKLAEPDNWNAFVDLYTNLVMAATRALGLVPQAALFASIVGGVVQGVGALVKYMVGAMVTDKEVPGLAAMEPDGEFVSKINETQAAQPDPQRSSYFAVTSNFEANAAGEGPKELPPRLLVMLADGFIDRLFKAPSDLVVDVESMTSIDPTVGGFVDDVLEFGTNPFVYHCNYFLRPEVTTALAQWFGLPRASLAAPADGPARRRRAARGVAHPRVGVRGSESFIEVAGDSVGSAVRTALREQQPDYVVVRRPEGHAYAFQPAEIMTRTSGAKRNALLYDSLALRETSASPRVDVSDLDAMGPVRAGGPSTTLRHVVFAGDQIVGVVPEQQALPPTGELAQMFRRAAPPKPRRPAASPPRPMLRRGGAGGGRVSSSRPRTSASSRPRKTAPVRKARAPARTATPHVHAEMPPEVEVGKTESVHVTISAQALARATSGVSAQGELAEAFDASLPLVVQLMARASVAVVDEDRATVQAPGPDEKPVELIFDIRGVSAGAGELWVVVRQGPAPLLTLVLSPKVVRAGSSAGRAARPRLMRSERDLPATVPASWSLPTLSINERRSSEGVIYEYDLDLLDQGRYRYDSAPILGDRDAYVNGIFSYLETAWLETNGDLENFAAMVRAYGGTLFDQLFPSELQALLWENQKRLKNVRIMSTEPFIPWELVHLKPPRARRLPPDSICLAQMGLVRWLYNEQSAPLGLQFRKGKAWSVTPDYPDARYVLAEPAKEAAYLKRTFAAQPVEPNANEVMALLTNRGAVDLFHFAGHGAASGGNIEDAKILLQGRMNPNPRPQDDPYIRDELPAMRIAQEADLAVPNAPVRPLVVLNACQVGRSGMQLSSIGGFAQAFIRAGAGAFVSSLWAVGDEPASSFTKEFYQRLKAGATIASATVAARNKAKSAGDATWLAYVVYAHPDAKLAR